MNGNYIKFYRSFLEWEWWHDPNTCRVFIYILLRANWTDSVYEYTDGYVGESDIRLYLENGDDDFGYIDITYKTLEEYFERID